MANYKRKRPRTTSTKHSITSMSAWPRRHDVVFHTRPKRRAERRAIDAIRRGDDPDGVGWPLGNHKPHKYFW
jgi:hypothetical protein